MRTLSVSAVFFALASAFLLYSLNYEARGLEAEVQAKERLAEKVRADIAVLKAERAHLARPERIEPLARRLGLRPIAESQIVDLKRAQLEITSGTTPAE